MHLTYASAASARSSARSKSTSIIAIRRATYEKHSIDCWYCCLKSYLIVFSIGIFSNKLCFSQLLFKCSNTFVILICTLFKTFTTTKKKKKKKKIEIFIFLISNKKDIYRSLSSAACEASSSFCVVCVRRSSARSRSSSTNCNRRWRPANSASA